jgi:superfamily II DNA or RNA helicase
MALRPYQQAAIDEISKHYRNGVKRVLLHMATGGGKTVVFSHVLTNSGYKGNRCIMVVRGRKLVNQASARLFREGVHHGVLMNGAWNYRPNALIQICSIDTLTARKLRPDAKLIVIDEAHMATSDSYVKFLEQYPNAFVLAVTATPYVEKSLRHIADEIVKPISMRELIDTGFLVDARYFAPSSPDLSGVKVSSSTHDYVQNDLANAMQSGTLVGDLVHHWKKLGENRPTLCFAATIGHSKNIVSQFMNAGISAEHCDADTPEAQREEIIKRLQDGITKVVSNVGIFCTGVDIPPVGCIIMARPTKSYNLYIQQAGRGTRPADGKSDFIILDHAGNVNEHGFITEEPQANLDGTKVVGAKSPKTCSQCYAVFIGFKCPACGYTRPAEDRESKELVVTDGDLQEITESPFESQVKRRIKGLETLRKDRGFKKGWVYYRIVEEYGEEIANRFIKKRVVPSWINRGAHSVSERGSSVSISDAEYSMLEVTKSEDAD